MKKLQDAQAVLEELVDKYVPQAHPVLLCTNLYILGLLINIISAIKYCYVYIVYWI